MKNWKKIAKQQAETIAELHLALHEDIDVFKAKNDEIDRLDDALKEYKDKLDAIIDIVGYKPIKFNYPNFFSGGTITTADGKYFYTINNDTLPSEGYK
jgi:hypothetical protein